MLLILALPLQTFASAGVMLGCTVPQQPATEQMAMTDGGMAGEMMSACHEHSQPDAPPAQTKCKHCVACALATALPVPVSESAANMPVSNRFAAQAAVSFSGFIPNGPERPPRTPLA